MASKSPQSVFVDLVVWTKVLCFLQVQTLVSFIISFRKRLFARQMPVCEADEADGRESFLTCGSVSLDHVHVP